MGNKRITIMDIWEIICRWHDNQSISYIANTLSYDRKTVRKYLKIARKHGIKRDHPLPAKEPVYDSMQDSITETQRTTKTQEVLEPFLPMLSALINDKDNPLKPKIAYQVICEKHNLGDKTSYSSFKRFVKNHQIVISPHKATCRIEVEPGDEVQIDYAKMGLLYDPLTNRKRSVYSFIATLSHSRHKYIEFVFKQDQKSFVASHVKMFEYFNGVPKRILLDNLKTGVIKPDLYDPQMNRTYREMAEHYGCFLDPCRVSHPKDKGKVERDVQTIRQQYRKQLALYPTMDISKANQLIKSWSINEYGQRKHGTTQLKPYIIFVDKEQPALKPLPQEPFEIAQWKEVKIHPDHYIQFNKKTYTAPHAYVGRKVWVKATDKLIYIYYQNILIKKHVITSGYRHTDFNDFPENVQAVLDKGVPRNLQKRAARFGKSFEQLIRNVLQPHAFMNLRKAQGLLSLAEKYQPQFIEQAATVAIDQKISVTPKLFKRMLEKLQQKDQQQNNIMISQESMQFIRKMDYFIHQTTNERTNQ